MQSNHEHIKFAAEEFCWRGDQGLAQLHRWANMGTAIPYFVIGILLLIVAGFVCWQNREVLQGIWKARAFDGKTFTLAFLVLLFGAFGIFILWCGIGHYGDYYVIDNAYIRGYNAFRILGYWKLLTAFISIFSALLLAIFLTIVRFSKTKYRALQLIIKIFLMPEPVSQTLSPDLQDFEGKVKQRLNEMLQ